MLEGILSYTLYHDTVGKYLISLGIFLAGFLAVRVILKSVVIRRLRKWAERTSTTLDEALIHVFDIAILPLLYVAVVYVALSSLTLNPGIHRAINVAAIIVGTAFGIRFLTAATVHVIEHYWVAREADPGRQQSLKRLFPFVKVVLWSIGVIFLLDNLGFKISTVVAGLGIGGIAVALAAQAVLGDLFSYFSMLFDRPFELGDFIIVGDHMGTVEHMGIKTTRLRSLSGEQLVFSNTDLTGSRVKNYKRMERRRVLFRLGVTYQTPLAQLREIPGLIRGIIEAVENTAFDRAHFASYGDFSLVFEVVYYVIGADYNLYMDIQQKINFAIGEEFLRRGIEFAYPTQTVFLGNSEKAGPE